VLDTQALSEILAAQLVEVAPDPAHQAAYDAATARVGATRDAPLGELLGVEHLVLDLCTEAQLRARAARLLSRLTLASGTAPPPPSAAPIPLETLRADLHDVVDQTYALYIFGAARDDKLRRLKTDLARVATGLIVIWIAVYFISRSRASSTDDIGVWLVWAMMTAGMIGATVSIIRRIQNVAELPVGAVDQVLELGSLERGGVGVGVALVSGAIFPCVLYALFASGIAASLIGSGPLIPAFHCVRPGGCAASNFGYVSSFLSDMAPEKFSDAAVLLVWAFLSGFAERLVPDVLDRIIARAADKPTS
jgi:hypothetical protein